jgi:hypothetical protein
MSKLCKMLFLGMAFAVLLFAVFLVCCALFFDRREARTPTEVCIANLKQLDGAKGVWALEHLKQTNRVPNWDDILGDTNYIHRIPICPLGGTYTLGSFEEPPRCSIPGHVLRIPE